jgi:hypothetical protein
MMGLRWLFRMIRKPPADTAPSPPQQKTEGRSPERPLRFQGGIPERVGNMLGRQDGERIGFRKPFE